MHVYQSNGFPCRCAECERERTAARDEEDMSEQDTRLEDAEYRSGDNLAPGTSLQDAAQRAAQRMMTLAATSPAREDPQALLAKAKLALQLWANGSCATLRMTPEEAAALLTALHAQVQEKEVCICAALRLDDGRVIRGHRHDDCIHTALKWKQAGQDIGFTRQDHQGFLTSRGRFVGRTEAGDLMCAVGHISAQTGYLLQPGLLFSEDLY